tara:strand:- start:4524 stop:5471 length:948 start_codon:yes stop_codon:yes gene_type:complete
MSKVGGGRNFGWGKQMAWAGKQAVKSAFGSGHFGTVASHAARWRKFCEWAREQGIRDARDLSTAELERFANGLAQQCGKEISVGYAKNQLTTVNVVMESLRGDRSLWLKPGDYLGNRSGVRTRAPGAINRDRVGTVANKLIDQGKERVAAAGLLCRELGLRRKEASLLDLRLAKHQAETLGRVNITAGTKGGRGRYVDRWVPVSENSKLAINFATKAAGGGLTLIPAGQSLAQWLTKVSKEWSSAAASVDLGTLRDLRAAYACDRYAQITGTAAPVVAGSRLADKDIDQSARQVLSQELGHNRVDVVAAYVGSSR